MSAAPKGCVDIVTVWCCDESIDCFVQQDGGVLPCSCHRAPVKKKSL
jgi:hypothetical protein